MAYYYLMAIYVVILHDLDLWRIELKPLPSVIDRENNEDDTSYSLNGAIIHNKYIESITLQIKNFCHH